MTTPPPADFPDPPAVPPPAEAPPLEPTPTPTKSKLPIILAAVFGALLLVAIAIGGTLYFVGDRDGLTREQAERECRTALEREAHRRTSNLNGSDLGVLNSVTGVDLQDVWETDEGWSVNGSVNVTMTTPILGQTPTSFGLTCDAVATDNGVRTTVKNRV
ncbi:hypothetical protein [Micromonospora sp. DT227]|uniref:hypothetical protein n=1 Tax=Micromonospora sp. DT227 TaxID=3393433 RepID=UPI003CEB5ED0